MLQIEDHEIEQRLESLGAHSQQAKSGLARQMLLQVSGRMVSARSRLAAELRRAEQEPLLELTPELWEEILHGPPRPEDMDLPMGLGLPPDESGRSLREFLAEQERKS